MMRVAIQRKPRPLSQIIGAPGRPRGMAAGTWVHDLLALKKAIMLCHKCVFRLGKSDLLKHDFRRIPLVAGHNHVISDCDGCRGKMVNCTLFQKRAR